MRHPIYYVYGWTASRSVSVVWRGGKGPSARVGVLAVDFGRDFEQLYHNSLEAFFSGHEIIQNHRCVTISQISIKFLLNIEFYTSIGI